MNAYDNGIYYTVYICTRNTVFSDAVYGDDGRRGGGGNDGDDDD